MALFNKFKARLVVKGFLQKFDSDYSEIFTPVVKLVRVFLTLCLTLTHKWPIQQLDVNNAFLNDFFGKRRYI